MPKYHVTGSGAKHRLEPLLKVRCWEEIPDTTDSQPYVEAPIGFVYETAVSRAWKEAHSDALVNNRNAIVSNNLHGCGVLEDKAKFALLSPPGSLETAVVSGAEGVKIWSSQRWGDNSNNSLHHFPQLHDDDKVKDNGDDWWCVKASKGNGGSDVFVLHRENISYVLSWITGSTEEFVIQQYISDPFLWRHHKCHFRVFGLIRGDLESWLYEKAAVLIACAPYSLHDTSDAIHISNLSVSKCMGGEDHVGQMVVDLPIEFPELWLKIKDIWKETCLAARPFMKYQSSQHHFELFGIDVMSDAQQSPVWIIEINRRPGMASIGNNLVPDDELYSGLMSDLLELVADPILKERSTKENSIRKGSCGRFCRILGPDSDANVPSTDIWRNVFEWAAFNRRVRRNRK